MDIKGLGNQACTRLRFKAYFSSKALPVHPSAKMLTTYFTIFSLLPLALTSPLQQKVLSTATTDDGGPSRPNDPDFPLLQPLPFNATIPGVDYDLIAKLRTSPNAVTRHALLPDEAYKFDFINPPDIPFAQLKGRGGTLVNALSLTMPALIGQGAAAAIGFTKPCGYVHIDPHGQRFFCCSHVRLGLIHHIHITVPRNLLSSSRYGCYCPSSGWPYL